MLYVVFGVLGVVIMLRAILRRQDATLVATVIVAAGVVQFVDWIAHGWFELYI